MNRFLTLCVMLLWSWQLALHAQVVTGTCGKNGSTVKWELDKSKGLLLIGGEGEMQDFEQDDVRWHGLEDKIYTVAIGKYVTSVGKNAFADCENLNKVLMGAAVESIGDSAFCNCNHLMEFKVAQGVKNIGETAFLRCCKLKRFTIDEGNECFEVGSCGELIDKSRSCLICFPRPMSYSHTDYEVPADVTEIGCAAFFLCDKLNTIKIHKDVKRIGEGAFYGCKSLLEIGLSSANSSYIMEDGIIYDKEKTRVIVCSANSQKKSVVVPETVTGIGDFAFSGCSDLVKVKLPLSLKKIGDNAFRGCSKLEVIDLPEGLESIGAVAFGGCGSLKNIKLPVTLKSIGNRAFQSCFSLKNIKLPATLESIDYCAFQSCSSLKSLDIPGNITHIGNCCLQYCFGLEHLFIPSEIEDLTFILSYIQEDNDESMSSLSNKAIFLLAAYYLVDDENIMYSLPKHPRLKKIEVDDGNRVYSSLDGILYDKEKKTVLFCGGTRMNVRLPETVEVVAPGSFASSNVNKVYFPSTVKSFGRRSLPIQAKIYLPCVEPPEIDSVQRIGIISKFLASGDIKVYGIKPVLHVPRGCKQKYLDHPVWGLYFGGKENGIIKDDID